MRKYNDLIRVVLSFFENNAHMSKDEFYFIIEKLFNQERYIFKKKDNYDKEKLIETINMLKNNINLLSKELSKNHKK